MKKAKAFIPALIWAVVLFILSTGNNVQAPRIVNWLASDKLGHAGAYFIFTGLILYGFYQAGSRSNKQLWIAALISSTYGLAMEVIQYTFFPGRYFEVFDIIANIIGILFCIIASKFLIK
jgi:VanZ family protein